MTDLRIFMSFDADHDRDLYDLIFEQSLKPDSGFQIAARSESYSTSEAWDERARRHIRNADEVIVICGEHTGKSPRMSAELRIAQEENKPYLLLWGRRESMCTRPATAKNNDSMYSWTREILQDQMTLAFRNSQTREVPEDCKRMTSAARRG
ncbi:MAG TPA: TIR domain-containing protein [Myxococcota bacterium]